LPPGDQAAAQALQRSSARISASRLTDRRAAGSRTPPRPVEPEPCSLPPTAPLITRRYMTQDFIAGVMAKLIIDRFEEIDVANHEANVAPRGALRRRRARPPDQAPAVQQARKLIGSRGEVERGARLSARSRITGSCAMRTRDKPARARQCRAPMKSAKPLQH